MSPTADAPAARRAPRAGWLSKVVKYCGGSVVATVCSEVAFIAMYGALGASTTWSSVVGWLAGALPNYWLNRHWTWGRSGPPALRAELLPYAAIVLVTLGLAAGATGMTHRAIGAADVPDAVRIALVAGAFLGVYGVMFVLKFVLFDRLFSRLTHHESHRPPAAEAVEVD